MDIDLTYWALFIALVIFASLTDWISLPVGLLTALLLFSSDAVGFWPAVLVAAGAVTAGRVFIAWEARWVRKLAAPGSDAEQQAMRAQLNASGGYAKLTFIAAMVPGLPPGMLFRTIGSMGTTVIWAALGSYVKQIIILSVSTWFFRGIATWSTRTDDEAASFLLGFAILWVVLSIALRVDWQYLREHGGLRRRGAKMRSTIFTPMMGNSPFEPQGPTIDMGDGFAGDDIIDLDPDAVTEEPDGNQAADEPDDDQLIDPPR